MAHQPKHILWGVHRNKVTYTKLLWESSVKKVRWVKKLIMIKRFTFSGYLLNCYVKFFYVRSTKKWANFSEISMNELFNLGTENSSQGWDGTNWWIDSFEAMEIKQDLKEKFVTKKTKAPKTTTMPTIQCSFILKQRSELEPRMFYITELSLIIQLSSYWPILELFTRYFVIVLLKNSDKTNRGSFR